MDRTFPGRPLIFAIDYSFYFEIAAGRGLPALPFWRGRYGAALRARRTQLPRSFCHTNV